MRQLIKVLISLSIVFALTGCNRMVSLSSNPPKLPKTAQALSHRSLKVAVVSDQREEFEPNMLMHFADMYGNQNRYGVYAREALAKTLGDTLRASLRQQGYRLSKKTRRLLLETRLQALTMRWLPGVWTTELLGSMRVNFRLENAHTGRVIWSDTFVARGKDDKHGTQSSIQNVYQQMSDSMMKQLLTSPGFRHAVRRG